VSHLILTVVAGLEAQASGDAAASGSAPGCPQGQRSKLHEEHGCPQP
jgi:hypothetical protein